MGYPDRLLSSDGPPPSELSLRAAIQLLIEHSLVRLGQVTQLKVSRGAIGKALIKVQPEERLYFLLSSENIRQPIGEVSVGKPSGNLEKGLFVIGYDLRPEAAVRKGQRIIREKFLSVHLPRDPNVVNSTIETRLDDQLVNAIRTASDDLRKYSTSFMDNYSTMESKTVIDDFGSWSSYLNFCNDSFQFMPRFVDLA